ncbi:MAG: DUF2807 domain-containing protein [Bacteroidales bacterium]|nr:DUF2807 domain-containing protein [Bacteroidales bacterium]
MRALTSLIVLCLFLLTSSGQEYQIPLEQPFEKLKISGNIHLQLVASDSLSLVVEEESMPEILEVEYEESILILKNRTGLKKTPLIPAKLFFKDLSNLEIARGAVVQSKDTLKAQTLLLLAETGGKVELHIAADSLNARVNQGADIILRGSARSQAINAYTFGNYLGYELKTERCWVTAATGAQVKVNCLYYLNANATRKAFIGFLGSPEVKEFKSSVGGKIIPQNP